MIEVERLLLPLAGHIVEDGIAVRDQRRELFAHRAFAEVAQTAIPKNLQVAEHPAHGRNQRGEKSESPDAVPHPDRPAHMRPEIDDRLSYHKYCPQRYERGHQQSEQQVLIVVRHLLAQRLARPTEQLESLWQGASRVPPPKPPDRQHERAEDKQGNIAETDIEDVYVHASIRAVVQFTLPAAHSSLQHGCIEWACFAICLVKSQGLTSLDSPLVLV